MQTKEKLSESNISSLFNSDDFLFSKEGCKKAFEVIYTTRAADKKMEILVKQNKGTSFFLSTAGHELVGAVFSLALESKKDWAFPYYRDRAFAIGLGCDLNEIIAAFLARNVKHHSSGRIMLDHFSHKELRIPSQSCVVGSQFLQAAGLAKGIKLQNKDEVVYVSSGDGATSQGDFHEALNFSCIHNLPVIFVIQDNKWAISVPQKEQTAGCSIAKIAKGYEGLQVLEVDGTDYIQLATAAKKAIDKARNNEGPSVIVTHVARWNPHTNSDDPRKYKDEKTIEEEKKKDPVILLEKWMLDNAIATEKEINELKDSIDKKIELYAKEAHEIPFEESDKASDNVFCEYNIEKTENKSYDNEILMMDAINHAIEEEMQRDEGVVAFGLDVAHGKGGAFGVTRTLTDKFKDRCFNTPLAESTIIGIAIGMSFDGMHKPIAEIQYADYVWTGINQLVNELSNTYYRSAGEWNCPVVVRIPYGGYIQGGPYHSQSLEGFLTHVPGLKIAVPSNAEDAKRLLKAAIRDPNPVIFLEHKALYRQNNFCKRKEPSKDDLLEFGKAKIIEEGDDVTVIAWGMMVVMAQEIAKKLKDEGISVEVIDLRTLVPLDKKAILDSVKKTSKVIVIHEENKTSGFGAELSAMITEEAFMYLDAPVKRVCAKDCPIPFAKNLENEVLPQKEDLEKAIRDLSSY